MMKDSVFDLSLDVRGRGLQSVLPVKRGDTARCLRIRLTEGAESYGIADGCSVVFTAAKPDGTVLYNACSLEAGVAVYHLTGQETNVAGVLRCELRLYDSGGKLLTSPAFCLMVEDTVYDDEAVMDSSPEFTALTALVTEAKALMEAFAADRDSYATKEALAALASKLGELSELSTGAKDSLVSAINELCRERITAVAAADGVSYRATAEHLTVAVGTEILLIPQNTNQGPATLSINGGSAYALCYRPGYFVGENYLRPTLQLPLPAESLLRGGEYVFRFDGESWMLQSYLERKLPDGLPAHDAATAGQVLTVSAQGAAVWAAVTDAEEVAY